MCLKCVIEYWMGVSRKQTRTHKAVNSNLHVVVEANISQQIGKKKQKSRNYKTR